MDRLRPEGEGRTPGAPAVVTAVRSRVTRQADAEDIVGRTPALARMLNQVNQVAGTNSAVLVTGETGTGKELVARAVHRQSRRRDKPLVLVAPWRADADAR